MNNVRKRDLIVDAPVVTDLVLFYKRFYIQMRIMCGNVIEDIHVSSRCCNPYYCAMRACCVNILANDAFPFMCKMNIYIYKYTYLL